VRLGTWNCQTGLDANWGAVEALDADVLTVQECGSNTKAQAEGRGWKCEWQPGRWHKGLAVLARPPYRIESRETSEPTSPFYVSTRIAGPDLDPFRFVGFWAMSPKDVGFVYTRQATRLIERLSRDGIPTVVAGDFNASKSKEHLANVQGLRELGLTSAYHRFHGIEHSTKESQATSYYRWRASRPFHMDFVFVPVSWSIEAVEVGTFDRYSRPGGMSDHVPVVVSVSASPRAIDGETLG
jgi:exonuclease III